MQTTLYPISKQFSQTARISSDDYDAMYQASLEDPHAFLDVQAKLNACYCFREHGCYCSLYQRS
jgi:hypothetical protein